MGLLARNGLKAKHIKPGLKEKHVKAVWLVIKDWLNVLLWLSVGALHIDLGTVH